MKHIPRKRFGQHFLHDTSVIDKIIAAVNPKPGEHLVEIGPGLGALTCPLLRRHGELDVVELDRDVIPRLQAACAEAGVLRIHQADALRFDFTTLAKPGTALRIVGNLPYNISTPLIFHLLESAPCISDMHFLLQKEVVDRLTAAPGGASYGRLSVMTQYRCRASALFRVGPGAFTPPPKVDSAVVRLVPYAELPVKADDEALFARLVNQAFTQRRKTLRNALKPILSAEAIEATGIDPTLRPENVSVQDYVALSHAAVETRDRPPA